MRKLPIILLIILATTSGQGAVEEWRKWFAPDLRPLEKQRAQVMQDFDSLGVLVVGKTAVQLGYEHPLVNARPPAPVWVQVDLQQRRVIDAIALVPALVDWQSSDRPVYGFPLRFQVNISDDDSFK